MRIDVFTIFPGMVDHFAGQSLVGKARTAGALDIRVLDHLVVGRSGYFSFAERGLL